MLPNADWIRAARLKKRAEAGDKEAEKELEWFLHLGFHGNGNPYFPGRWLSGRITNQQPGQ